MFMTNGYNLDMTWQEWITHQYLVWRMDKPGHAGSAANFARNIGFTPQLMNEWINRGKIPTDYKIIQTLISYFGPDVCDVLGVPRPESLPFENLPSDIQANIQTAMLEFANELNARSIDPESEEAEEISRAILSRHGLTVSSITRKSE